METIEEHIEQCNNEIQAYVAGTLWDQLCEGGTTWEVMAETIIKAGYRWVNGAVPMPEEILNSSSNGEMGHIFDLFYEAVHRLQVCRNNESMKLYDALC